MGAIERRCRSRRGSSTGPIGARRRQADRTGSPADQRSFRAAAVADLAAPFVWQGWLWSRLTTGRGSGGSAQTNNASARPLVIRGVRLSRVAEAVAQTPAGVG